MENEQVRNCWIDFAGTLCEVDIYYLLGLPEKTKAYTTCMKHTIPRWNDAFLETKQHILNGDYDVYYLMAEKENVLKDLKNMLKDCPDVDAFRSRVLYDKVLVRKFGIDLNKVFKE